MEMPHFHGYFCSFRDFFPLFLSLSKENVQFLAQNRPGRFVLCCGLVSPAKEWLFRSIHRAPEPKSEE